MKELQDFAEEFQRQMNWDINSENYELSRSSLLNNYMLLTTEIAEVAEELRKAFNIANQQISEGINADEAFENAKIAVKQDLGKEFADCLAYITKMANFFSIDLEESFYSKMDEVKNRNNKDISLRSNEI